MGKPLNASIPEPFRQNHARSFAQHFGNTVLFVAENNFRFYRLVGDLKAHDDDFFPGIDEVSGGSVDADDPRSGLTFDDIGLKPGTGRGADNEDFLADPEADDVDEIFIYRDAAHIVNIRLRDGGEMDLGSE